ncbi:N-formylglutamate deformylase [Actibacterium ureilyticum]|uniref:N-formylglutamate deformylase n=1 Tax=Actibacterium ureilyticum TaxID=1590614 RepID=UPI000BAAB819|nr:N-formylglutamate deformylase [Actibacterium ureilyticum]
MVEITRGDSPLVLGLPHTGTELPDGTEATLNATGRALADTDWHIHDLYAGLVDGVTTVRTRVHRYVIDVNRDPAGHSLYPGQNTTALCPLTDFDGRPIHNPGQAPDAAEVARRLAAYHAPYHAALAAELARVRAAHGFAILYDCHSIRSQIPFLFDGTLPDFNIGTDGGQTCATGIAALALAQCRSADGYSTVLNGRFKGGWTTRHYGRPGDQMHAIQMELAQATYMIEEPPWRFAPDRADRLRARLKPILQDLIRWRPA